MRRLLCGLLIFFAEPAFADVTATYATPDKTSGTTIEFTANGDWRGSVADKPGAYYLSLKGQCYAVIPTPAGPVADRCGDWGEAVKAVMKERTPEFLKFAEEMAARTPRQPSRPEFVKGEDITIRGRTGTAWYLAGRDGATRGPLVLVINHDPDLAQLGTAMVLQFELAEQMQYVKLDEPYQRQFKELLKTGAPIMFPGVELTTVSHDPIAPSRFELPGPVESLSDIAKRMRAKSGDSYMQEF